MLKQSLAIILALLTIAFLPYAILANGGDQRVVEGTYLINLSRAPFTPRVGIKTSFLASFVDIQKGKLIAEDLIVNVRIAKLGGPGSNKRTFIFEQDNLNVQGGVLEFPYTFADPGLHEIFFDFAFASNPQQIYEAPDFLIDVQKQAKPRKTNTIIIWSVASGLIGVAIGWFVGRNKDL